MTHESLLALVDLVNSDGVRGRVFLRPLGGAVDLGYAWPTDPTGSSANESCYRVYFVRDKRGTCIGAVDDLGGDIHAIMKPEHRRHGIMTAAMRDLILPHMFSDGREVLRARLCSQEGRAFALRLGFTPADDDWVEISSRAVTPRAFPEVLLPPLGADRASAVDQRIRAASACLSRAYVELKDRSSPQVLDELTFAAYWIDRLVDPELEYVETETPEPTRSPLDEYGQKKVERLIYEAAAWLRMVADEMEGRNDSDRVDDARRLAKRIIDVGQDVRDDWHDRQTQQWIAEQRKPN